MNSRCAKILAVFTFVAFFLLAIASRNGVSYIYFAEGRSLDLLQTIKDNSTAVMFFGVCGLLVFLFINIK
jgi:hypothetical protein